MTPKQESEYIRRTTETIEKNVRHAIEEFRLSTSQEPNCIFVSPPSTTSHSVSRP